jgi:RNA polymerase sigma-70 factor (ECF subfamily)
MESLEPSEITQILERISAGKEDAIQQLFPLVYDRLRRIARRKMAREPGQTLQTTALVHEVYIRLLQDQNPRWENRRHFFAVAAEAMRRILVENARRRSSLKRGGWQQKLPLQDDTIAIQSDPTMLLAVDQALKRLQAIDPSMNEVFQLRCFAGLTVEETANALAVSPRSVDRYWSAAKAWLYREIYKK